MKKIQALIKENKTTFLTLFVIAILSDVLFLDESSDLVIFGVLITYLFLVKIFQIKSKSAFLLSLSLLGAMFFSYLISSTSSPTEKLAVWSVLFLIIGIIQRWRE